MIRIIKSNLDTRDEVFTAKEVKVDVAGVVSEIISKVRLEGDSALYYYLEKFDKVRPETLRVSKEEIDAAVASMDPEFVSVLEAAAKNIREFHAPTPFINTALADNHIVARL